MVLGCILCRQPLITYINLHKKKLYLKGQLRKEEKPSGPEPKVEIKETQLVLAKCGHLFHRNCLKSYVTHNTNLGGNASKRECPFCFKQVVFGHCINIYLNAETNDVLVENVKQINDENDELHAKLLSMKADLAKKNNELTKIYENVAKYKTEKKEVLLESENFTLIENPEDSITPLKEAVSQREKFIRDLTQQNSILVSLIEKQATHSQKHTKKMKKTCRFHDSSNNNSIENNSQIKKHNPIVDQSKYYNKPSSLRQQYHSTPPILDTKDSTSLEMMFQRKKKDMTNNNNNNNNNNNKIDLMMMTNVNKLNLTNPTQMLDNNNNNHHHHHHNHNHDDEEPSIPNLEQQNYRGRSKRKRKVKKDLKYYVQRRLKAKALEELDEDIL